MLFYWSQEVFSVSTASIPIFTDAGSNTVRMSFRLVVTQADGTPLTGEECTVTLEGDGSLAPRHDAKRILRQTNAEGAAELVWYRRGVYGRDVHATLTVEVSQTEVNITIEQQAPAAA